jgi:hypothetical protein
MHAAQQNVLSSIAVVRVVGGSGGGGSSSWVPED